MKKKFVATKLEGGGEALVAGPLKKYRHFFAASLTARRYDARVSTELEIPCSRFTLNDGIYHRYTEARAH